mmetsp:Transcript_55304/g.108217  ORF Transcript_55304/g.108217 Transcript_55304/m.108217 type:complete len:202 (+) Transcript_55304:728-1333(+)
METTDDTPQGLQTSRQRPQPVPLIPVVNSHKRVRCPKQNRVNAAVSFFEIIKESVHCPRLRLGIEKKRVVQVGLGLHEALPGPLEAWVFVHAPRRVRIFIARKFQGVSLLLRPTLQRAKPVTSKLSDCRWGKQTINLVLTKDCQLQKRNEKKHVGFHLACCNALSREFQLCVLRSGVLIRRAVIFAFSICKKSPFSTAAWI